MGIENKLIVLHLNANWQPIGTKLVRDAFTAMNSEDSDEKAAYGVDIDYPYDSETGKPDFSNPFYDAVKFDDWVTLPIRDWDFDILMAKEYPKIDGSVSKSIRVPTVIVAKNFNRMPEKDLKPTKNNIRIRDNDTCQYSGRKLRPKEGNVDHVIPRDIWRKLGLKGSPDTWENMVWCDKEINNMKGNRTNEEVGLKLVRKPRAPLPRPACALIRKANHFTWKPFIINEE